MNETLRTAMIREALEAGASALRVLADTDDYEGFPAAAKLNRVWSAHLRSLADHLDALEKNARYERESGVDSEDNHIIRDVVVIDRAVWEKSHEDE